MPVTAGTTYVASYHTTTGHYAYTANGLASAVTNGPLTALAGGGVYAYGSSTTFPANTFQATNYWVDVVYQQTQGSGPSVASATPAAGSSSNPTSTDPSVTFSEAVVTSSVSFTVKGSSGNAVAGSTSFDSTDKVATFTPSSALAAGTTYTVTVSGAKDSSGNTMASPYTFTFTTSKAFDVGGQCPCTIWPDIPPAGASRFTGHQLGEPGRDVHALQQRHHYRCPVLQGAGQHRRPYRHAVDGRRHQLATGTFTNESTQGWEELDFSTPVPVTAGTTYVASYSTTTGHYADTANGLASAVTNGPLTALAGGGVYAYGSPGTFPANTFQATNYWVNVVFTAGS